MVTAPRWWKKEKTAAYSNFGYLLSCTHSSFNFCFTKNWNKFIGRSHGKTHFTSRQHQPAHFRKNDVVVRYMAAAGRIFELCVALLFTLCSHFVLVLPLTGQGI